MSKKSDERAAKAAEALRQQQRAERRRTQLSVLGVVLAMVLIIGAGFAIQRARDDSTEVAAPTAAQAEYGVTIGDADAPHQVVIYEDFLCPFCGELEAASHERLAKLAEQGKVQVDYRPFDLLSRISDYPVRATNAFAVVLDAAGPEVAKKFHDLIYASQPSESGPFPDDDWLVEKAVEAGATEADVRPGIEDLSMKSWVTEATQAAIDAGVNGTPTVLVDGKVVQDASMQELADSIIAQVE
ncbi:MAG: thioredoxin domain-containing protein [Actinobacteria bacterium]|uniref:Unannotated protein n=1 Tax=freshwater metagenome TaxID=449393 RepID=A0A6J6QFR0_9ZZZZ|nr:thioredoxin domain-containing protein [Actinomycetota bacterium]